MLHITFSKYDCIIVHKAYYLFTCTCVSINSFHSHSHSHSHFPLDIPPGQLIPLVMIHIYVAINTAHFLTGGGFLFKIADICIVVFNYLSISLSLCRLVGLFISLFVRVNFIEE